MFSIVADSKQYGIWDFVIKMLLFMSVSCLICIKIEEQMIITKDSYMDPWYEPVIQFKYNKQYHFTELPCFD